jgi:hypothetical protein
MTTQSHVYKPDDLLRVAEPPPLDFAQWEREQRSFLARSNGTKAGIALARLRQHAAIYWKRRLEQK